MKKLLALAVAVFATASIAVPAAADARTADDSRCTGPDANDASIYCGPLVETVGCYNEEFDAFPQAGCPPEHEELYYADLGFTRPFDPLCGELCDHHLEPDDPQCGSGYRIWGTNYNRLYWQWDYYVEGGEWVVWSGAYDYLERDFVLPGGEAGLSSLQVRVVNWNRGPEVIHTRLFWLCEKLAPGRSAAEGGSTVPLTPVGPIAPEQIGGAGGERFEGDRRRDALIGEAGDDRLVGRHGSDHLHAGKGHDSLRGGDHADQLYAGAGHDKARGGDHADEILTGAGNDEAHGGSGHDRLFDNKGRDVLRGGPGNDRFSAFDGARDMIYCGPGEDIAMLDRRDKAIGCEHVYRSARETPETLPKI